MASGIVRMMDPDVVPEEGLAQAGMAKAVMEQGLTPRHDQMSSHRSHGEQ